MPSPYIFFDTEFTHFCDPQLLSIGLVDQRGRFFYGELPPPSNASTFVRDRVLSQWGRVPSSYDTLEGLGAAVGEWLAYYDQPVLCYDYHTDGDLLEHLLSLATPHGAVHWQHVGYLYTEQEPVCMTQEWHRTHHELGVAQHHALADAYALRALFESMHGAP